MSHAKHTIGREIVAHIPFTAGGAALGILIMLLSRYMPTKAAHVFFDIFHPLHVFVSALATASIYQLCQPCGARTVRRLIFLLCMGYVGSVGIATLSDSLIPYVGERLVFLPEADVHAGFIERWWLVNPLAILGILWAYVRPVGKFPHALHVLLSVWASLFHMHMAAQGALSVVSYGVLFLFLLLSVWIPCCMSDIVFPLLFVRNRGNKGGCCGR